MATSLIGVDVLIEIGSGTTSLMLGQRNAELSIEVGMIDMRVKNSFPYAENLPGWQTWSIDCDGLVVIDDANGIISVADTMLDGTKCNVKLKVGSTGDMFTGQAYISNLKISSPHEGEATYSCTLTGTGQLTPVEGS